jgi:hypothetical protein
LKSVYQQQSPKVRPYNLQQLFCSLAFAAWL